MRDANEIVNQERVNLLVSASRGSPRELLHGEQRNRVCRPTFPRERDLFRNSSSGLIGPRQGRFAAPSRPPPSGGEGRRESQPSPAFFVLSHRFERRRQLELDPAYTVDDLFGAASVRRDFRRGINSGGGRESRKRKRCINVRDRSSNVHLRNL